jgi:cell wall-associated NlpC family hydrolase
MTATRQQVVLCALQWVRTPYHHQGRVKGVGVDCAGLGMGVFQACGLVPAIDAGNYPPDWNLHHDTERLADWVEQFATRHHHRPQPGDVVLYRFGRAFGHLAIVVDWPLIVHAARRNREVLVEDGQQGEYAPPREWAAYTVNGLEEV